MSLKILIFPFIIILSLILIIGYIKPDVEAILAARTTVEQKQADLAKVDTVIQNIRQLNAEIEGRRESEAFVLRYLPPALEEERVLDTLNFLAGQSGVIIQGADISENQPVEVAVPQFETASVSFEALAAPADGSVPVTPPTRKIESYQASVKVLGSYQSLKDFFVRLARTDRFHKTRSFVIAAAKKEETSSEEKSPYPADFLEGDFEADFTHFRPARTNSALNQPLFQSASFDFSAIDDLLGLVNNPLPPLEAGAPGRPNPFQ